MPSYEKLVQTSQHSKTTKGNVGVEFFRIGIGLPSMLYCDSARIVRGGLHYTRDHPRDACKNQSLVQ